MKTSILAMKCAKLLQTATSTTKLACRPIVFCVFFFRFFFARRSFAMCLVIMSQEGQIDSLLRVALTSKYKANNPDKKLQTTKRKTQLLKLLMRGLRPEVGDMPRGIRKLMEDCWAQNPAERPNFEEILGRLETDCKKDMINGLEKAVMVDRKDKKGNAVTASDKDLAELKRIKDELEEGVKRQKKEIEIERNKAQDRLRQRMTAMNMKRDSQKKLIVENERRSMERGEGGVLDIRKSESGVKKNGSDVDVEVKGKTRDSFEEGQLVARIAELERELSDSKQTLLRIQLNK